LVQLIDIFSNITLIKPRKTAKRTMI